MAIRFRPSKHWKNWPALSSAHSTNSSTMEKSHLNSPIYPSASRPTTSRGAALGKKHASSTNFADC